MASALVPASDKPPTLQNLIDQESLKWVFVGGKGGVGKTTTSCCLGVQLAARRKNVLIVSTDPAHNLSDAFGQKFGRTPTLVEGFANLYCMEIDPSVEVDDAPDLGQAGGAEMGMVAGFMKEFSTSIPGIDELMSFAELMKHVQSLSYDVTVFDTAPTGHTLRLLSLPGTMESLISKVMGLRERFGPMFSTVQAMMGASAAGMPSEATIFGKLDEVKSIVDAVQARIHNPDETTFVCVCIPEFLSLYETERLVQELSKFDIDTHNIVVNQVLFVDKDSSCMRCQARRRMQAKYLDQIGALYEDFHVALTPLLNDEIRGAPKLTAFGRYLMSPYSMAVEMPAVLQATAAPGI